MFDHRFPFLNLDLDFFCIADSDQLSELSNLPCLTVDIHGIGEAVPRKYGICRCKEYNEAVISMRRHSQHEQHALRHPSSCRVIHLLSAYRIVKDKTWLLCGSDAARKPRSDRNQKPDIYGYTRLAQALLAAHFARGEMTDLFCPDEHGNGFRL